MRSPIPDYLAEVLHRTSTNTSGAVADYIPELTTVDPDTAAIALATVDGVVYAQGDVDLAFALQSMSKPFAYILALADRGIDWLGQRIGIEPSGEPFNEISLEPGTGRPRNAMINAGAIATHGLIRAANPEQRLQRVVDELSRFAGRRLEVDRAVARSELADAHRNLAMGHLLRSFGIFDDDPVEVVEGYINQCAVSVTVGDVALMAATLANGGVQPRTGQRLVGQRIVRHALSVMLSAGMYDSAGDWLTRVGVPAKSGVSGGIIGVLPGQVGIAVFSPRLDAQGNSVRGVAMLEQLSRDMGMHLMEAARPARSAIRDVHQAEIGGEDATIYELHGDLVFSSAESLIRRLVEDPPDTRLVVFDTNRVDEITTVAARMLRETARRIRQDGHEFIVYGDLGTE